MKTLGLRLGATFIRPFEAGHIIDTGSTHHLVAAAFAFCQMLWVASARAAPLLVPTDEY
jgi:hypothetical protein